MSGPVAWETVAFSTAKCWEAKRNMKAPKSQCHLQEQAPNGPVSIHEAPLVKNVIMEGPSL